MRRVIVSLCTSLDSYIEGENGEIDWCLTDQDYSMTEFLNRIDTIFIGRKSYEQLLELAPNAFADKLQIIFSKTIETSIVNTQIISENIEDEVNRIKNAEGKDIWLFGGANLISSLLRLNLVDELMISVHPLILGKGKNLFIDIDKRIPLKYKETKTYSTGLVQLYYDIVKE